MSAQPLTIDFAQEKEAGYRRIYARSPLLTSLAAGWDDIYFAYNHLPPGETPEIFAAQHGVGIFIDQPIPAQAERKLGGEFRREQVVQGNILVSPAQMGHEAQWDAAGGVVFLGIQPALFSRVSEAMGYGGAELIPHFATPDPLLCQMAVALKTVLETYGSASRLYAETMTTALIVHLLQYYSDRQPKPWKHANGLPAHKLQRVIDYIQASLERDLGLEELAAIAQLSAHYFCQLFKQSMHLTPHQYVIRCRIERAKDLLRLGDLSIAEVARCVGFVDQSHLHRHFKRIVGMTPKAFLQHCKN
ncbi:helix-turn-helix transcriptional regulator [Phormidium tenue FACHB-886]|nr:helix-turn-helix transcriptional regulator [Phormidium tenue FACHB-886]